MRGELATLRASEKLCVEHRQALDREAVRMEAWIKDLKESHDQEKAQLQAKIATLEDTRGAWIRAGVDPVPTTTTTTGISDDPVPTTMEDTVPSTTADPVPTATVVSTSSHQGQALLQMLSVG